MRIIYLALFLDGEGLSSFKVHMSSLLREDMLWFDGPAKVLLSYYLGSKENQLENK